MFRCNSNQRTLQMMKSCKLPDPDQSTTKDVVATTSMLHNDNLGLLEEKTNESDIDISDIDDPTFSPRREKMKAKRKTVPDYFNVRGEKTSSFASTSSTATLNSVVMAPSNDNVTDPKFSSCPYLDGTFFKVIQHDEGNKVKSECQLCLPKKTYIKGKFGVSTNFIKHIKTKHETRMKDYETYKLNKKQEKHQNEETQKNENKRKSENDSLSYAPIKKRNIQGKITDTFYGKQSIMNQKIFDERLLHFLTETMSAFSILERPSFISLFEGTNLTIMSRYTAARKISDLCKQTLNHIQKEIDSASYVCTTADIWSAKRRSFLGLTCHWIGDDYVRRSAALSCRRFFGCHTYDKIAENLEEIQIKFNINTDKLVATVTDNGSNFVKAFKEFSKVDSETVLEINNESEDEECDISFNDFIEFDSPNGPNASGNLASWTLPKHVRCASHTLNLIATTDVKNAIEKNLSLRTKHTACVKKCSALWKMAGRPKTAEVIEEVLGHTLSYPGATRWNSFYDAISQILKEKDKLLKLFEKLGIQGQMFKESELQYLTEYCTIMKPIATALDILQGENNNYYGYLMPCLGSVWKKLEKIESDVTNAATLILQACKDGLQSRFKNLFDFTSQEASEAIIASFTLPQFKLRWTSNFKDFTENDLNELIPKIVADVASKYCQSQVMAGTLNKDNAQELVNKHEEDFFEFDDPSQTLNCNNNNGFKKSIELEILQYLHDPDVDLKVLNKYSNMKKLFIRFNTCLTSSAPVERLFSFAEIVNSPRRNALTDQNFENLVLLKANNKYIK